METQNNQMGENNLQSASADSEKKESWFSEYGDAFKDAFFRVWKYRWLWFWGILLPAGGGMSFNNFGDFGGGKEQIPQQEMIENQAVMFFQQNWGWIALGIAIFLLLMILFWILSAIARSGVIQALSEIQDHGKPISFDFKQVWKKGKKNMGRIIGLDLTIIVIILLAVLILIVPLIPLFASQAPALIALGVILILLFVLAMILVSMLVAYIKNIATVYIVLSDEKIITSIKKGYSLVTKNIKEALKLLLFKFFVGILHVVVVFAVIVSFIIIILIIAVPFIAISGGFEGLKQPGAITSAVFIGGIILLAFIAASLLVKSIFALWSTDIWVWWTKKLGGVKVEERAEEKVEEEAEEKIVKKAPAFGTEGS